MKKVLALICAVLLLAFFAVPAAASGGEGTATIGGVENDIWISKHGNVHTDCSAERFLGELGFAWGDVVTVEFLDQRLTLPVVAGYSYVESGESAIIVKKDEAGLPAESVTLAINMGSFAQTYGLAEKVTDAEENWHWEAVQGVQFPVEVTFTMAEKEGYLAQFLLQELSYTSVREDYAHLEDGDFANFRGICTPQMDEGRLYRTSSPIDPEIGRNAYADAALKDAGVTVILNLAESREEAQGYPGFADSYYAGQNVAYLDLEVDVASEYFKEGLARGLRFFAQNEGVYAVHCTEGKDRAGFVSALLECFMGASYEQVIADYMVTYSNYYGVEPGTDKYDAIARGNIEKTLQAAFEVENLAEADLEEEATQYIRSLGLSDREVGALKANLAGKKKSAPMVIGGAVCLAVLAVCLVIRKRAKAR